MKLLALITFSENLKEIVPFNFQNHGLEYKQELSVISLFPEKKTPHLLNW